MSCAGLRKTYFGTLCAFTELAELRGGSIDAHSQRVANLARQVALKSGMSDAEAQNIFVAALLHDIGMIGFPDEICHKPVSAMTSEDLTIYRKHPTSGAAVIGK